MNILVALSYIIILNSFFIRFKTTLNNRLKNYFFVRVLFFVLLLFFAFHNYSLLPDLPDYIYYFEFISRTKLGELGKLNSLIDIKLDHGFIYLNKILSYIISNLTIYFFVIGFLILWPMKILISKYSLLPIFSIFLYFTYSYYESLFLIRQSLALGILMYSIPYLANKKYVRFLLFVLIAATFHQTAIIFCLLLVLNFSESFSKTMFVLCVSLVFILPLKETLIISGAENLRGYESYVNFTYNSSNSIPLFINLSLLMMILFFWIKYNVSYSGVNKVFINMIMLSTIVEISRYGLFGVFGRINIYFMPAFFILIPNLIYKQKNVVIKLILSLTVITLFMIIQSSSISYGYNFMLWK